MQATFSPSGRVSSDRVSTQIVVLLAVAVFINYIDRGNLATAAPLLKSDLGLSTTQLGFLLSAFFWTYTPVQLVAGWMVERFDVHRLLAAALFVWSVATAASGLAGSFGALLLLRLLLGLGESLMYPGMSKLVGLRVANQERGKANGTIGVGQALGPAFGTLLGGLLMAQFGWRAVMVTFGALSLLWLWPWLVTTWRLPSTVAAAGTGKPPSYAMILRRREAWGACLGQYCSNYSL